MARPAQPMQVFPKGRPAETLEGRQRHQWAESSLSTGKGTALHRMRGPEAARVTSGTARLSRHVSKLARRSLPVHRDKHPRPQSLWFFTACPACHQNIQETKKQKQGSPEKGSWQAEQASAQPSHQGRTPQWLTFSVLSKEAAQHAGKMETNDKPSTSRGVGDAGAWRASTQKTL